LSRAPVKYIASGSGVCMKVKYAYKKFSGIVDTVNLRTPIEEVINIFMKSKKRRSVYVVDESNKLIGIITANEVFTSLRPDITLDEINFFLKGDRIKVAEDVMIEPTETVTIDDDVETALRKADNLGIQDVPVCKKGKLIGELDAFELVYGLNQFYRQDGKKPVKCVKTNR
jgi:CBS domain-containing protein